MGKLMHVKQVAAQTFQEIEGLTDEWRNCLGDVEDTFVCFVWGDSANGKTSFISQLIKELSKVGGNILYVSYEEGQGKTVKKSIERNSLIDLPLQYLDRETFVELRDRLKKKKSPKIVIIDSLQYSRFTYDQYKELKESFVMGKSKGKRKILIIISHATGKEPRGASAQSVRYDANIKIYVKGFIAEIESRYESVKNFVIWEERAKSYWGRSFMKKVWKLKSNKELKQLSKVSSDNQLELKVA